MHNTAQGPVPPAPPAPATAAQGPEAAARTAANAADAALDARLEAAAKKAALRELEAQAAGAGPEGAPAPPQIITINRDGNIITLENPTADQLAQVGIARPESKPPIEGWTGVAIIGGFLLATVTTVRMVLSYWRSNREARSPKEAAELASRMARIENAIESVAVEVERISEGQRFASRMIVEGSAVPVSVAERGDAVRRAQGDA